MNIEVFKICAICFGSLAIICLIVALILFFKLKIPYVIGELRGNIKSISIQVKEQENKIKDDGLVSAKTPENEVKSYPKSQMQSDITNVSAPDEDEEDNFTKPLEYDKKIFDDFKIIKNVVFVNTREEIKLWI